MLVYISSLEFPLKPEFSEFKQFDHPASLGLASLDLRFCRGCAAEQTRPAVIAAVREAS